MATFEKCAASDGTVRYRLRSGSGASNRGPARSSTRPTPASGPRRSRATGGTVPTSRPTADRRRTLAELIDKFGVEYLPTRPRNATPKKSRAQLKLWKEHAGYLTLHKVTRQAIAGSVLIYWSDGRAGAAPKRTPRLTRPPATFRCYLIMLLAWASVCERPDGYAAVELQELISVPLAALRRGGRLARNEDVATRCAWLQKAARCGNLRNFY